MMTTTVADQTIGVDKMMLVGVDTSEKPLYSISEMAQFFFARSSHWVRWLESCDFKTEDPETGKVRTCGRNPHLHEPEEIEEHKGSWRLSLDGELLEPIRTKSNARKYDLSLIEKIAHALASNSTIDMPQLRQALRLVQIQAEMFGYIAETYPKPVSIEEDDN